MVALGPLGTLAAPGSPSPQTAAAAGTPVFLSPPSLLLLRLLLADSSRRILHVNNIQALFTVAAGRRGTHASTLEEGGGGGKASAQHLHTPRPAPPCRSPLQGPGAGRRGAPRALLQPALSPTRRGPRGNRGNAPGRGPPLGKITHPNNNKPSPATPPSPSRSVEPRAAPGRRPRAQLPTPRWRTACGPRRRQKAGGQRWAVARPRPPSPPGPPPVPRAAPRKPGPVCACASARAPRPASPKRLFFAPAPSRGPGPAGARREPGPRAQRPVLHRGARRAHGRQHGCSGVPRGRPPPAAAGPHASPATLEPGRSAPHPPAPPGGPGPPLPLFFPLFA